MTDIVGLTSDIGTWLAILLGLIALIGIVGPLLLLREARSDRSQALNAVDIKDTGYLTKGIAFRKGTRLFRKINVPLLEAAPSAALQFQFSHFSSRIDKMPQSSTGWVNLAALITAYVPGIKRGKNLQIYEKKAWMPCHRLWILAIGLHGWYGHRKDRGHAIVDINTWGLVIDDEIDSEDDDYGRAPSTERLYGITGTIRWKRSLDTNEASIDEVYFTSQPTSLRQSLIHDGIDTQTLFWLSVGCCPISIGRVFDLHRYEPPSTVFVTGESPKRSRTNVLLPSYELDGSSQFYRFVKHQELNGLNHGGNRVRWANSMGANMNDLWSLQKFLGPVSPDEENSLWYSLELPSQNDRTFIWQSDIHCIALALMKIKLIPKGFLFDQNNDVMEFMGCERRDLEHRVVLLSDWAVKNIASIGITMEDAQLIGKLPHPRKMIRFSRRYTQLLYDLEVSLSKRKWDLPLLVQHVVGILTITSQQFQEDLENVLEVPFDAFMWTVEIDKGKGVVRTIITGNEPLTHNLNFSEVFPDIEVYPKLLAVSYTCLADMILTAFRACLRYRMFENTIDSNKLLRLVRVMDDKVLVSADELAPHLLNIEAREEERQPPLTSGSLASSRRSSIPRASPSPGSFVFWGPAYSPRQENADEDPSAESSIVVT